MDTKSVLKESLLALSMTMIASGATMLGAKDLYGLVLIGTGFAMIAIRSYLKLS